MNTWLVDTGPLVAYLDGNDPAHVNVSERLDSFTGQLVTTSAVVTEAMHFVATSQKGPRLLAELVVASGMDVYDLSRPPELLEAVGLMEKFADIPMDFADATLVLLAEGLNVHDILTLDRRGFSIYRTRRRRHLQLVLDLTYRLGGAPGHNGIGGWVGGLHLRGWVASPAGRRSVGVEQTDTLFVVVI